MNLSSLVVSLRRIPVGWRVAIGIAVFVVVAAVGAAIEGPEKKDEATTSQPATPSKVSQSPQEREEAVRDRKEEAAAEFKESIADSISSDDEPRILCIGQTHCGVTYEIEELAGIDPDEELVEDQRDVWAAMFENPKFARGLIKLEGPVETIGGKASVAPVLIVRCDRAAANQIDWENVRAEGLKQLCDWQRLVE